MTRADQFRHLHLRCIRKRNRLVDLAMCQFTAVGGLVHNSHFAHLIRFALGGFGTEMVEATAISASGTLPRLHHWRASLHFS